MNPRTLTMASAIALALTFGMFFLGSRVQFGKESISEETQSQFIAEVVLKLNQIRAAQGVADAAADPEIQAWLESELPTFTEEGVVRIEPLLEALPEAFQNVTNAAARTITAKRLEDLQTQIEFWADGYLPDTRLVATRLYRADRGRIGCALVAAKRVPKFDLARLNDGATEFYNECKHCGEPHLGSLSKVHLALAVSCPHCGEAYDLLAADMFGRYHRAHDYLEGMSPPPGVGSGAESRFDEMMAIWKKAVESCRYAVDLGGSNGEKDTWQRPSETYSFRNGDCEDSSLMLADWLIARGFDARVAIGQALAQGGHAWVVVRLHDKQYLLETTMNEVPQMPPEPVVAKGRYQPQFLFDRRNLYFPSGPRRDVIDYFSPSGWKPLTYERQAWEVPSYARGFLDEEF